MCASVTRSYHAFRLYWNLLLATLLVIAALFRVDISHAQLTGKGGISGTVTDPSGAAVPGAKITITDVATGVSTRTTSTAAGDFSVSPLDPGNYNVVVTASGFEQLTQENVQV